LVYGKHIAEEDLSLYAMRALEPGRNAEAQRHLDTCAKCRGKLAEIINGLSLSTLTPSDDSLSEAKVFLLNRIKAEARLQNPPEPEAAKASALFPARNHSRLLWLSWILAAAAIGFAIYMENRVHKLDSQLAALQTSGQSSQGQRIMSLLHSPTALRMALTEARSAAQSTAQVIYDKDRAGLIFIASRLQPLPPNRCYTLWLIPVNESAPVRVGFLYPDAEGNASLILPPLPMAVDARTFGVTLEEGEQAAVPTQPFLLQEE
jgi:anti-sigma factor RsiW